MKNLTARSISIFLIALSRFSSIVAAQQLTLADYKRAVSFMPNNLVNKEIFNINIQAFWAQDNSGFAYMKMDKTGRYFEWLDFGDGEVKPLFDVKRLVKVLSDSLKSDINPRNFSFNSGRIINKNSITFTAGNKRWKADLSTYELNQLKVPPANPLEKKSPDGKWSVYVKDYNLYLKSLETGVSKKLSKDGTRIFQYGTFYDSDLRENDSEPDFPLEINWYGKRDSVRINDCRISIIRFLKTDSRASYS